MRRAKNIARARSVRTLGATWVLLTMLVASATAQGPSLVVPGVAGVTPTLRFNIGSAELVPILYPERGDPASLAESAEWIGENAGESLSWWAEYGPELLARYTAITGLRWPYEAIDIYLVRSWPVISIEYPLVLALESVPVAGTEVDVPRDSDVQVLLLAHQLTHYLLDAPLFVPEDEREAAYRHPFMAPGDYEVEALANWVTYTSLTGLWGRERLERAAGVQLWRLYNPNHDYVVDELEPRYGLSATQTLADWLATNGEGSEIFRVHTAYVRQDRSGAQAAGPAVRDRLTGTEYGLDLGESFDGQVFVAYVDRGSRAEAAGVFQGDIVHTVEGRSVGDVVSAQRQLEASWAENKEINLSILREDREIFLSIE